jgi:hypothetical protein
MILLFPYTNIPFAPFGITLNHTRVAIPISHHTTHVRLQYYVLRQQKGIQYTGGLRF